jgi:hypothetical protein
VSVFKCNDSHRQASFFGFKSQLPEKKRRKLDKSWGTAFYEIVFNGIDERIFAVLYDNGNGRPNAPVNRLVASLVLMHMRDWTYEELFEHADFDLLTRTALGLDSIEETPFCEATIFNFQNRLLAHFTHTGEDLLEQIFDSLTAAQIKRLGIRTDIQRCDSFQAMSNIARYSRIQLLVEMLLRLERILSDDDRVLFTDLLRPYHGKSSGQFIHSLGKADLPHALDELGRVYHALIVGLGERYKEVEVFAVFERVWTEHFTLVEDKVAVKPPSALSSDCLQSPDDLDATFRAKSGKQHKGQVVNIAETAAPDNPVNLLTDIVVAKNNVDDGVILSGRIDPMVEKTPDLNELHTDGAFGNEANDAKLEAAGILQVTTAVKGREAEVPLVVKIIADGEYEVACPCATAKAEPTGTRMKAHFPVGACGACQHADKCPAVQTADGGRTFYFDHADALADKRAAARKTLPDERRNLRPNVEASVNEFSNHFNHKGKLKVRGAFKCAIFAFCVGMAINFGRVFRYLGKKLAEGAAMRGSHTSEREISRHHDIILVLTRLAAAFCQWIRYCFRNHESCAFCHQFGI